tara:strand:+ start:1879 stop:3159 length:1281 start_codon:yes stop_codon:yes gene_type:complete
MNLKKYDINLIFSFKDKISLSKSNEEIFNDLQKKMNISKSVQTKQKKEFILNNEKWCRKIFLSIEEKKKKKVNSYLNMCSKSNYEKISLEICKLKIDNDEQIEYLIDILIQKYRYDYNLDIWNIFIKNLIFKNVNKWKFNNIYVARRLLNKINNLLNEIIESNYQDMMADYFMNNIELFYKTKNINNGLMKLISLIFSYKLISKYSITEILRDFTLNINQFYKLELGINLIKYIYNYVNEDEKLKFIEYFNLFLKEDDLNIKVKFMILDFFDKNKSVQHSKKLEDDNKLEENDEVIELFIKNNINLFLENKFSELKIIPEIKYKLNKIVYYFVLFMIENDNKKEKVNLLFMDLIKSNTIKINTLKYGFIELLEDYNEYQYDNLNINDTIKYIFSELIKNKYLTEDNVNFILSKVSIEIRNKINYKH